MWQKSTRLAYSFRPLRFGSPKTPAQAQIQAGKHFLASINSSFLTKSKFQNDVKLFFTMKTSIPIERNGLLKSASWGHVKLYNQVESSSACIKLLDCCMDGFVAILWLHNASRNPTEEIQTRPAGMDNDCWTYFCPHRLVRGAGKLEANWRRGQPRSRQIWSPSPDCESSATHDGERTVRKSLVSFRRTIEPGVHLPETWSAQLVMPTPGECRHKYK